MTTKSPFQIGNVRLFIAFRTFFNARFYYPVFTILFLDYGLTIEQFSILNTVWAITIVCAEVPSGALADLLGRKRLLVLTSVLMIIEMSVIAFVPVTNMTLVFWAFLVNRILSGLAEAMASGADEAIAYDSLKEEGNPEDWPRVLSVQMRVRALARFVTMTIGALVYDPAVVNQTLGWLGIESAITQQTSMRFPIYLTGILALLAFWSTIRLRETNGRHGAAGQRFSLAAISESGRLVLNAGLWIMHTPFALAIILFGMMCDHVLRLIGTLTSQYLRLIDLPEASFGIIMALLSLLGLLIPKLAEFMVKRFTPSQNAAWLGLLTMLTLWSLTGFVPYFGVLPMALVMTALLLTAFFTSHYLNLITSSDQRATVLSFKGLAFNLAYGLIGILFAVLISRLRTSIKEGSPELSTALIENEAFRQSFGWFPWYGGLLIAATALFCYFLLKNKADYGIRS